MIICLNYKLEWYYKKKEEVLRKIDFVFKLYSKFCGVFFKILCILKLGLKFFSFSFILMIVNDLDNFYLIKVIKNIEKY